MKYISILILVASSLILSCSGDKVPAYKAQDSGELAAVKLPPTSEKTLSNGLKLIAVEHHELPVVSFRLMVKSGALQDPLGKAGLAQMTAGLLTKGTHSRSATDIAEAIDFIGGNLNSSASWDKSNVSCQVLKKHFQLGLDLFADVILNPVFQKSEIDRLRKQTISSYIQNKDELANLANEYFNKCLYGDHPFGFEQNGTDKTLPNINRQDIIEFYKNYYVPNNSIVVVSGDIDPEMAFASLEAIFGNWKMKNIKQSEIPDVKQVEGYKILLVNKKESTQSQIRLGHFGISRSNPDYFSVNLMNYILGGGGFASRLMKTIRADMGLTYGIYSRFSARKIPGPFYIGTFTKNESVGDAIEEILKQLRKIRQETAKPEELADAKSYLNGSYPMRFETPNQVAGQLLHVELYGLGDDYISTYRDKVQNVDLQQVKQAAAQYIDPDNMVIVVVGNKDEVYDQLTQFGEVEVREID